MILGDGDGRFLVDLLKVNRRVLVDSLDVSPGMIALARRRLLKTHGSVERVRFILADARASFRSDARYDLIVTNFFLDCFPGDELGTLIERVASCCLPGALWLDGDFRLLPGRWTGVAARAILAGMYLFFALTTRLQARRLTDSAGFLAANGFTLVSEVSRLRGFLSSRVWRKQVIQRFG